MNTYNNENKSIVSCTNDWNAINWHKIQKYVDKLQKRIYHAESKGEYRKVRGLQRMLLNSNAALLIAIKRVTQYNKGKRTAGIDGFRVLSNSKRMELYEKMKNMNIHRHKPKPVNRTYIRKKNGKYRSLGIPTIIDRVYQEITRMALEPQAEYNFEPTSYGFRPKRDCHDALKRIWHNMNGGNWKWVFEGDFKSCFDNLNHEFILKELKGFPAKKLVEKFLKAGYMDNGVFNPTNKGTPQGGLISPLLANIALTGLEKYLNITYNKRLETRGKYRVIRYADDFVILAKEKSDILKVKELLTPYLEERGLTLAEDKTKITNAKDGFDFLGFNIRLYRTIQNSKGLKCIIKPSKDSIDEFKSKARNIFREHYGHNVDELISRLNPLIRGTANYWKASCSSETFAKIDNYLFIKTYKFIRRLHRNKPWKWIKNKYYPQIENGRRIWTLTGPKDNNKLLKMKEFKIRYHTMVKHNYSPYDKDKVEYFNKRNSFCN